MSFGNFNNYTGYRNRKSIRLQGYDYTQPGYYFVTICVHDRTWKLFGDVTDGNMAENQFGEIVRNEILKTEQMRPNVKIDECIIMPNHVHVIIHIRRGTWQRAPTKTHGQPVVSGTWQRAPTETRIEQFGKPISNSIPTIIRLLKSTIKTQINVLRETPKQPVWQRNYYEHVVRDETSLFLIRNYIRENPLKWDLDFENHIDCEIKKFEMSEIND